ncbi:DNA cytosine methyltransferase [Metapseudomonas otitidis]|uniref:DNA cytosine methyltransferase n=1 Tax=Metapseudomonas otitidis TaxID=319939 RepID=UPI003EDF7211
MKNYHLQDSIVTTNSKPTCIDLFCGAGGLSYGLELAGFNTVAAVDFDANATATFRKNHPHATVITDDISRIDAKVLVDLLGGRELDLLAGGPSCQGYSTHGKRDQNDPRNFLFEHYLRIAEALRPKWILIENVQGLLTYNRGYFREVILAKLQAMGYHADARVLNAADYGVPQLRKRIFFIATRTDQLITFPAATHSSVKLPGLSEYVTVGEALADLPPGFGGEATSDYACNARTPFQKYLRGRSKKLELHTARPLSAQAHSIARHVQEGFGLRSVPIEYLPDRFKKMRTIGNGDFRKDCTTLYHRLSRNKPSYTITTNFRNIASGPFLHPTEDRSLTPREAARLMTFPDDYQFLGTGIPRQIGNAVPPLMAKAMGEHLLKLLKASENERYSEAKVIGRREFDQACQLSLV